MNLQLFFCLLLLCSGIIMPTALAMEPGKATSHIPSFSTRLSTNSEKEKGINNYVTDSAPLATYALGQDFFSFGLQSANFQEGSSNFCPPLSEAKAAKAENAAQEQFNYLSKLANADSPSHLLKQMENVNVLTQNKLVFPTNQGTFLHVLAQRKQRPNKRSTESLKKIIELLQSWKINIDATDAEGNTALSIAQKFRQTVLAAVLIERGATQPVNNLLEEPSLVPNINNLSQDHLESANDEFLSHFFDESELQENASLTYPPTATSSQDIISIKPSEETQLFMEDDELENFLSNLLNANKQTSNYSPYAEPSLEQPIESLTTQQETPSSIEPRAADFGLQSMNLQNENNEPPAKRPRITPSTTTTTKPISEEEEKETALQQTNRLRHYVT